MLRDFVCSVLFGSLFVSRLIHLFIMTSHLLGYFQRIVSKQTRVHTLELMRQVSQGVATDRAVCVVLSPIMTKSYYAVTPADWDAANESILDSTPVSTARSTGSRRDREDRTIIGLHHVRPMTFERETIATLML